MIYLASFWHESNTFSHIPTTLDDFRQRVYLEGKEINRLAGVNHEVCGFMAELDKMGAVYEPVIAADANPGGPVSRETFETIVRALLSGIDADRATGILLALHGATVIEGGLDGQVELLRRLHAKLAGRPIPIVVTVDFHANVDPHLPGLIAGLCAYRTQPHVDVEETGRRAARLLVRLLETGDQTVLAHVPVPTLLQPEPQETHVPPLSEVFALLVEAEADDDVLSAAALMGFPNADLPHTGASVVVTARRSGVEAAKRHAKRIATAIWERRGQFLTSRITIEEALHSAERLLPGPVVIGEIADGVNQGGSASGAYALPYLLARNIPGTVYAAIADPVSVEQAHQAGVGSSRRFSVGGRYGEPVELHAYVRLLSDGAFTYHGPASRGLRGCMGRTAVVVAGHVEVVLTERRTPVYDPALLRSVGIQPAERQILVIKQGAFCKAAFGPITKEFIFLDSPGWGTTNYARLSYQRLRRPVFPLDPDVSWTAHPTVTEAGRVGRTHPRGVVPS